MCDFCGLDRNEFPRDGLANTRAPQISIEDHISLITEQLASPKRLEAIDALDRLIDTGIISDEDAGTIIEKANKELEIDINRCFRKMEEGIKGNKTFDIASSLVRLEEYYNNLVYVNPSRLKKVCEEIIKLYSDDNNKPESALLHYEVPELVKCAERLLKKL